MGSVVILHSGGLDSTVLAYHLAAQGHTLRCLTVDYGQAQRKELDAAHYLAHENHWPLTTLPMGWFAELAPHDGDVVPGRNAVLWSLAVAHAQAHGCAQVVAAMHRDDYVDFPDCRFEFLEHLETAMWAAYDVGIWAPFLTWPKAAIVRRGAALGVPFEQTWSCYRRGPRHCGTCLACTNRRNAFRDAGVADPTEYEETACAG